MAICPKCQALAEPLKQSLTVLERTHVLSAVVAMARTIEMKGGNPQDRAISSSVTTKLLLSFDPASREKFREYFRTGIGLDIQIGSCGHKSLEVVT